MVRKSILSASLLAGGLLMLPLAANSAGLGKLTVTSELGQPLRAEVDLLTDPQDDLSSLSAHLAALSAFKNANIDYVPVLSAIKFSIEKRSNGQNYIKISSSQPINDPFLDLLVQLDWSTGSMVREYTILLDPPGFKDTGTPAVSAPVVKSSVPSVTPPIPAAIPAQSGSGTVGRPGAAAGAPSKQTNGGGQTYGVKKGDTLAKIAQQYKSSDVSLDQMLVGLYETNRDAFAGKNMNRLKTGQILRIPSKETVTAVSQSEAAKQVRVQAADWNAYRQKLAASVSGAPAAQEEATKQTATGKITTSVEDKAAKEAPSRDVLKLSRGEAPGAGAKSAQDRINALQEEATAKAKALQDANSRISELEKNVQEMQKLLEIKNQALADLQKQAAGKGAPVTPAQPPAPQAQPAPAAVPKSGTEEPLVKAQPETPPSAVQPAPEAKPNTETAKPAPKPQPALPAPESQATTSWYDDLLANPLYLAGAAGVVLLSGLLWLLVVGNRRKKGLTSFEDSIMTGGDLKANTVLGETSGGVIDTGDTSFLTDFSQAGLGTIDTNDVDPIAEAEVYMAYGRDAQAEEILKEAMVKDPNRHEIQLKLLEIYSARRNLVAFETLATELYAAIGGKASPIWEKAAEMGRELDPNNPLYSGGAPVTGAKTSAGLAAGAAAVAAVAAAATLPQDAREEPAAQDAAPDLDFDVDEDLMAPKESETLQAEEMSDDFDLDFDMGTTDAQPSAAQKDETPTVIPEAEELELDHLGTSAVALDLDTIIPQAVEKQAAATPALDTSLEFDMPEEGEDAKQPPSTESAETKKMEPAEDLSAPLDFDFGLDSASEEMQVPAPTLPETSPLDLSGISLDMEETPSAPEPMQEPPVAGDEQWREVATKLDLAKAYLEMGDREGAREILQEVVKEGDESQQSDAKSLLAELA